MALIVQNSVFAQNKAQLKEMGVASSKVIQHISYDSNTLQLTVTMRNGAQYIHSEIYPEMADDFFRAQSKGSFYSRVIKGKSRAIRLLDKSVGPKQKRGN